MESPDRLEERVKMIEDALGISGVGMQATKSMKDVLPIGSIVVTQTEAQYFCHGTWTMLHSGNILGGQVGTVYVWKRTA